MNLDGTRDRAALLEILQQLVSEGVLVVEEDGKTVHARGDVRKKLEGALDQALLYLACNAMIRLD